MANQLSRRNLLRFSRMQQERLDNYTLILAALALDGPVRITSARLQAAQDAVTDDTEIVIHRSDEGLLVVASGMVKPAPKDDFEIVYVEA